MTLDSFQTANSLAIESILLPHYGLVSREEARRYLNNSQRNAKEMAWKILNLLEAGKTREQILEELTVSLYSDRVRPIYPIDAFRLNTGIMVDLVAGELT